MNRNDIFISYSRYDSTLVNEFVALLENEGFSVWIDRDGIESGDEFKRVILRAIKESSVVVFFSSEHSNQSDWTAKEIGVAVKYRKHIVPIILDSSNYNEVVEFDLINLDYVNYLDIKQQSAVKDRLLKSLKSKTGREAFDKVHAEAEQLAKEEAEVLRKEQEKKTREDEEHKIREEAERARIEKETLEREEAERLRKEQKKKAREEQERKVWEEVERQKKTRIPDGALRGIFSVSPTKKVFFSRGNLQYQGSTGIWRFAERQYSFVGVGNEKKMFRKRDWIDLFGWGTGNEPMKHSTNYDEYQNFVDWGKNKIANGGNCENLWRTLTHDEWDYVIKKRQTTSGFRFAQAKVNGVNGMLLLPDDWNMTAYPLNNLNLTAVGFDSNSISAAEWGTLNQTGVVFLPAAGFRSGTSVKCVGSYGFYWSASYINRGYMSYGVFFGGGGPNSDNHDYQCNGRSVRLVCLAE
ncbi:MAG: TIR domain-containing protein [Bacteroidales bacterium]|nr:TIR domain-containing protein [Bacteroidales bacterium]